MTKPESLLRIINEYYNKKSDKYNKIFKNSKDFSYKIDYDNNDEPELRVNNKGKNILIAKCQTIGLYNEDVSMWYWSWNIPFINRKQYKDLIKIKGFSEDMKKNSVKYLPYEIEDICFYLENDSLFCYKDDLKPINIALYLSKGEWVVPIEKVNNNMKVVEYVLITEIKSLT